MAALLAATEEVADNTTGRMSFVKEKATQRTSKPTLADRFHYHADNFFATNPFSRSLLLIGITTIMIALGAVLLISVDSKSGLCARVVDAFVVR